MFSIRRGICQMFLIISRKFSIGRMPLRGLLYEKEFRNVLYLRKNFSVVPYLQRRPLKGRRSLAGLLYENDLSQVSYTRHFVCRLHEDGKSILQKSILQVFYTKMTFQVSCICGRSQRLFIRKYLSEFLLMKKIPQRTSIRSRPIIGPLYECLAF